jgi:hypothetical protein
VSLYSGAVLHLIGRPLFNCFEAKPPVATNAETRQSPPLSNRFKLDATSRFPLGMIILGVIDRQKLTPVLIAIYK